MMILNSVNMANRLSVDDQEKELTRIKEAPAGTELFKVSTSANTDVIDTLLHKSKVRYHIGVAGYTARYYKDE